MDTPDLFSELFHEGRPPSEYHYQAALEAAKKMRATRQKAKACSEICAHLRQMLQDSEAPGNKPQTTH